MAGYGRPERDPVHRAATPRYGLTSSDTPPAHDWRHLCAAPLLRYLEWRSRAEVRELPEASPVMPAADPTEVIASWIPHDARRQPRVRAAGREGIRALREYVTGLVLDYRDGDTPLTDEYDRATLKTVHEDLHEGPGSLADVNWSKVHRALLPRPIN